MRRFVIIVSGLSAQQRSELTESIKLLGVAWSHYLPEAWLIVDNADLYTPQQLSNLVTEISGHRGRHLVLPVGDEVRGWFGRGPDRMFDWLRRAWNPHDTE
jgi:hypothetical protein